MTKSVSSQTLIRGLDIIEAVANGNKDLAQIAESTNITYSTAHRIVSALVQRDYLKKQGRNFSLGRKVLELGFSAYSQVQITQIARPILQKLADQTSDTVHLVEREQNYVIYLDKISSQRAIEISSRIGGVKPLISTGVGKAMLLSQSESEWVEIYNQQNQFLKKQLELEQWLEMMRNYRLRGYAYDKGEDELFIRCVAAPIKSGNGKTIAAVSVSSAVDYMNEDRMQDLVPLVQAAARDISKELGYA